MLQVGICNAKDLLRAARKRRASDESLRRPCFIGLYEEALTTGPGVYGNVEEAILFSFTVANGAFKRTSRNRFAGFDKATIDILRESICVRNRFSVHDLAVSDARTAAEFFAQLSGECKTAFDFYASDLCLKVVAIRRPGTRSVVVVDEQKNVLQLMFAPFVLPIRPSTRREKWFYPVNSGLRRILMRTAVKELLRLNEAADSSLERREILLVCKEARNALERCQNFHLETYDAFARAPRSYSVVRAMNLLNRSYFSDHALATIIANIAGSLLEDGILITGSNFEAGSTVNGTIYRKQSNGFVPIYASGKGSPVDDLIPKTIVPSHISIRSGTDG